jgi:hypothetical protein
MRKCTKGQMEAYLRFASGFTGAGRVKNPGKTDVGTSDDEYDRREEAHEKHVADLRETFGRNIFGD